MGQYSISTVVKLPFEQALRETRQALKEEEFAVITEIDLQAQLAARLHQQIRPYTILGVWVPSWEYEALSREPDIGLLMPSHVCVWDNGDGTCTLATADLKHLCHTEENTPLAEAARAVNARLRAVVASVQFARMTETPQPLSPTTGSNVDSRVRSIEARVSGEGATAKREPPPSPANDAVVY